MAAHLAAIIASKGAMQAASVPNLCARRAGSGGSGQRYGRLGPGQDRATKARVRRERRCLCRAPGAQTAAAQGSPEPSAIFTAWQSLAGVKLCKPSTKKSDPKKVVIGGPLRVSSDSARE